MYPFILLRLYFSMAYDDWRGKRCRTEKRNVSDIWEAWHLDGLDVFYYPIVSFAWQGNGIGMEARLSIEKMYLSFECSCMLYCDMTCMWTG